jgi:hypothetical protein
MDRNVTYTKQVELTLGDEMASFEVTLYGYAFMSGAPAGKSEQYITHSACMHPNEHNPDDLFCLHSNYKDIDPTSDIACVSHQFGVKDFESPALWNNILIYLCDSVLPAHCTNLGEQKKFEKQARLFIYNDNCVWKVEMTGRNLRLLITDLSCRQELIAEAHNEVGHQGRDSTYKTLADRYYWPNLYDSVAYFVRSCYACQLRACDRPKIPFTAT